MVRNIKLTISYDGTNYNGWQKQNNKPTVQNEIEKTIYIITNQYVDLVGSGRTDAGVHALGQVANFKTESIIQSEKMMLAINANINKDIRILKAEDVDIDFNSRFNSKQKTYLYQIYNDRISSPFYDKYSYHIPYDLDIKLMEKALAKLKGEHDFEAFMSSNSSVNTTVRTIYQTSIEKDNKLVLIRITGNGFLYNMVRIIVGTLIDIGNKKRDIECLDKALLTGDRKLLGSTAKPEGLFLEKLDY